ncbi:hypothetical protein NITGR_160047 [Nitrospina gracilis 3/211]|uniref:Uncharacterized protein n=1 Tax=Nitrospina gracilis (strain 3/211) TaxID=1266370 RepID=M1YW89_NITG3|nr:hypothetical protein NITGR_160047 [Nitrospina gracilis 3/211]
MVDLIFVLAAVFLVQVLLYEVHLGLLSFSRYRFFNWNLYSWRTW